MTPLEQQQQQPVLDESLGHEFVEIDNALTATPFIRVLTEACSREPCRVKRVSRVFQAPGGRPVVCAQGHDVHFVYPIADEELFGAPESCAADCLPDPVINALAATAAAAFDT